MANLKHPDYLAPYYFDEAEADRRIRFFRDYLRLVKGKLAGEPYVLPEWQERVVRELFGWKRRDNDTRRYRRCLIAVPKKNAKSTLAAGLVHCVALMDREQMAEIYSCGGDRKQAKIVFDIAKRMAMVSPLLRARNRVKVNAHDLFYPRTWSRYEALSADASTKAGVDAHLVVFDELLVQTNADLFEMMLNSQGARSQPLFVSLTTAGSDRNSVCRQEWELALKVLDDPSLDPQFLPVIYGADEDDDWTAEETWYKANPNLGTSISIDYLRERYRRAVLSPAYENTFKRDFLNLWVQQITRYLPMEKWDQAANKSPIDPASLESLPCFGGLDLSKSQDLTAFVLVFPPEDDDGQFIVLPHFFIPENSMKQHEDSDRVPFRRWAEEGIVTPCPGDVIDYRIVQNTIEGLGERYDIQSIAFDRAGAWALRQDLEEDGFTMVQFSQGIMSISPPTKELLRLVTLGRIRHGGNPCLRWNADNLMVKVDENENVKPVKQYKASAKRIDGIVALIMALDLAIKKPEGGTKYGTEEIIFAEVFH